MKIIHVQDFGAANGDGPLPIGGLIPQYILYVQEEQKENKGGSCKT